MFEAFMIYGYLALGNFLSVVSPSAVFAFVVYCFCILISGIESGFGTSERICDRRYLKVYNSCIKYFNKFVVTMLLVLSINSLYPSKEDLKWIIGGALVWNGAEALSEDEGFKQLPKNTIDAMNHFLKSIQEETKDD